MTIYAFGDSHVHYLFALCPDVKTFWLGPRTMHRVGRDGAHFVPHLAAPEPDDTIILVFGEIDVRCHVGRIARLRGLSVEYVIGDLVDRYVVATRMMLDHFGIRARAYLLGAPPPLDPIASNPGLPVHGPLAERVAIRRRLNLVLEEHARAFGIGYVPIPALYEEPDGSMRMPLSDGHAHVTMDHAHHVILALGEQLGTPLRFDRPPLVERLRLRVLRTRAFRRHDHVALWDLGQRISGRRRDTATGPRPAIPFLPPVPME